jgi:hypothetical protein
MKGKRWLLPEISKIMYLELGMPPSNSRICITTRATQVRRGQRAPSWRRRLKNVKGVKPDVLECVPKTEFYHIKKRLEIQSEGVT